MKKYKLCEIFDLQMGKTPARNNPDYWENGTNPWISIADMTTNGRYIKETKESITDTAVYETGIYQIYPDTVIMSFKLSVGKVAQVTVKSYSNEAIMAFKIKDSEPSEYSIDNEYAYYLLSGLNFENVGNKAVMGKTLNKRILENTVVHIHKWEIQRKIIAELDKVNALIELRKQQLSKLDELVKSRFVEMFGDPVSNPMNWEETTIGKECYYIKDGPHKSLADVGEGNGYPFISVRNIVNGKIDFSTARYISEQDYIASIKKCHPQKGDMLYSKGGTTGIAKLIDVDIEFANWVHVAVLKYSSSLNGIFFEKMLNSNYCYEQSQKLTKGVANRDLVLSAMAQIKLYKPPIDLQTEFATFVEQTDKLKFEVKESLEKLETLKKSLMQKYFGKGECVEKNS